MKYRVKYIKIMKRRKIGRKIIKNRKMGENQENMTKNCDKFIRIIKME